MSDNVIDLAAAREEQGPWGVLELDCRACGHFHVGVAKMDLIALGEPFACPKCHERAADKPWMSCSVTCPCGQQIRVALWEPMDIMPVRWPCPKCGTSVPLPGC